MPLFCIVIINLIIYDYFIQFHTVFKVRNKIFQTKKRDRSMMIMTKQVINVDGMSCEHCVKSVANAIKSLPGIGGVDVSLKKHTATVKFDENKTSLDGIKEAIREIGYETK